MKSCFSRFWEKIWRMISFGKWVKPYADSVDMAILCIEAVKDVVPRQMKGFLVGVVDGDSPEPSIGSAADVPPV